MEKKTYPFFYGGVKQDFAKAVVIGDFVFLSGVSGRELQTGRVKAVDAKVQAEIAWAKIKTILEEVGTSLDRIVKMVIYLRNVKDYDAYYEAVCEILKRECPDLVENPPAQTMFGGVDFYLEEMLFEIDITAVLPKKFNS